MTALKQNVPVIGAPCWVNLMSHDLEAAHAFYRAVLSWEFRNSGLGDEFSVALASGGSPVAGVGSRSNSICLPAVWTPYFAVTDADQAGARIRERGGIVAIGPIAMGGGRAGLAADPDGAVFGFWEGPTLAWSVGDGAAPARLALQTRDARNAASFYTQVFKWAEPDFHLDHDHNQIGVQAGGQTVAVLREGGNEADFGLQIWPRWIVDFHVEDPPAQRLPQWMPEACPPGWPGQGKHT